MTQNILQLPFSIPMENHDVAVHGGLVDEAQQESDGHQLCNSETEPQKGDELRALEYAEHRSRLLQGRETRHHRQRYLTASRKKSGSSASEYPANISTKLLLRPIVKEPGGRFNCFNTLPSGAEGADFVAKLVLYGE